MDCNPLLDVAEKARQAQLEINLQELTTELKKVNDRLTEIEELLKAQNATTEPTSPRQTYIK